MTPATTVSQFSRERNRSFHPFFHFLMLAIGIPAAILAFVIMVPFRILSQLAK